MRASCASFHQEKRILVSDLILRLNKAKSIIFTGGSLYILLMKKIQFDWPELFTDKLNNFKPLSPQPAHT